MNPLAKKGKLGNSKYSYKAAHSLASDAGKHNRGQKAGDKAVTQKKGVATPLHPGKVMENVLQDMRKNKKKASTLAYYDNVGPEMSK